MSGYDKTIILLLWDDHAEKRDNDTAKSNAIKLRTKYKPPLPDVLCNHNIGFQQPMEKLAEVTAKTRLYIVAHGTYGTLPTVGGREPGDLASFLHASGLRSAQVISLVACNSGWGGANFCAPTKSFGELFHAELAKKGIYTEVRARIGYVHVTNEGQKKVEFFYTCGRFFGVVPKDWNKKRWSTPHLHAE